MHRPTDPYRPETAPGNPRPGGDGGSAPPRPAPPDEAAAFIARLVDEAPPIGETTAERLRGLFSPYVTAPTA